MDEVTEKEFFPAFDKAVTALGGTASPYSDMARIPANQWERLPHALQNELGTTWQVAAQEGQDYIGAQYLDSSSPRVMLPILFSRTAAFTDEQTGQRVVRVIFKQDTIS